MYRKENYPFALLYFTGSADFNRLLRLNARKKGFALNDYGLVSFKKFKNEEKDNTTKIKCYCESDIFKTLGIEYIAPEDRDL